MVQKIKKTGTNFSDVIIAKFVGLIKHYVVLNLVNHQNEYHKTCLYSTLF